MTPLTKALLSKCEFEMDASYSHSSLTNWSVNNAGARAENARLMPLILALAECVEALELIAEIQEIDPPALERLKGLVALAEYRGEVTKLQVPEIEELNKQLAKDRRGDGGIDD